MMKKTFFTALCILTLSATGAFAFDWTTVKFKEIPVENAVENTATIQDESGNTFVVENASAVDAVAAANIVRIKNIVYTWRFVTIKQLRFFVDADGLRTSITPAKFVYNGVDYTENLSAGLLFTLTDNFKYNFRVTKGSFFLRIRGVYINEKIMCDKIEEALKNPAQYIERREPEYLLEQVDRLESVTESIKLENERLRQIIIALHNGVIFNSGPLKQAVIDTVVDERRKNPTMKRSDFSKLLKGKKIEVSDSEVDLILKVYLSDFSKD